MSFCCLYKRELQIQISVTFATFCNRFSTFCHIRPFVIRTSSRPDFFTLPYRCLKIFFYMVIFTTFIIFFYTDLTFPYCRCTVPSVVPYRTGDLPLLELVGSTGKRCSEKNPRRYLGTVKISSAQHADNR